MDAQAIFLQHLHTIERASMRSSRRYGLWEEDAEDFAAWVKLQLIEDDYAVIRKFRGESSIEAFLVTVVVHYCSAYSRERLGRPRPSTAADRMGSPASHLERFVDRDGYRLVEASEMLRTSGITTLSDSELARLLATLRERVDWGDAFAREVGAVPDSEAIQDFAHPGIVGPDGLPISQEDLRSRRIITDVTSTNERILKLVRNDPKSMYNLAPRQFEELIAELLHQQGYEVDLTPASNDGGFDMFAARKDGLGEFLYLVECKRYAPIRRVGVEIVRSLYGVVQRMQASAGIVVTTSHFTKGAEAFQQSVRHQLSLRDYLHLQQWLSPRA